jgi:hypothetical protein
MPLVEPVTSAVRPKSGRVAAAGFFISVVVSMS